MNYTITNLTAGQLALDSVGVLLGKTGSASAAAVVDRLSSELVSASQGGFITVVPSEKPLKLVAESNGQTVFSLPFAWPTNPKLYAIILGGHVLTPTTDYVIDAQAGTLTYQHSNLVIGSELIIDGLGFPGRDIAPESIPVDALDAQAQALLARVSWGSVTNVNGTSKKSRLQMIDANGTALAKQIVLRITCDSSATIKKATSGVGEVLSGENTNDMVVRTDASGRFDLTAVCSVSKAITVAAGATQGSQIVDCSATIDFNFAA